MDVSTQNIAPGRHFALPERWYSIKDVIETTSLSEATIYRRIKNGEFPRGLQISPNRVVWPASVIAQWQAEILQRAEMPEAA